MTIDNLDKMDWKKYLARKMEVAKLEAEKKKFEREKNKYQPASLESLDEKLTKDDFLLLQALTDFFFQEISTKEYKEFLQDYCYNDETFIRTMNKLRRLKDKVSKKEN